MNTHLLVYGNPVDGFTFIGPITPNDPELEAWIENHLAGETWWYAPLKRPEWKNDDRRRSCR